MPGSSTRPPPAAGGRRARRRRAQPQQVDAERRRAASATRWTPSPIAHRAAAGARPQRARRRRARPRVPRGRSGTSRPSDARRARCRTARRSGPARGTSTGRQPGHARARRCPTARVALARGAPAGKRGAEHRQAEAPRPHRARQRHRAVRPPPAAAPLAPAGPAQPHARGPARRRAAAALSRRRDTRRAGAALRHEIHGMRGARAAPRCRPRPCPPGRRRRSRRGSAGRLWKRPEESKRRRTAHAGQAVELGVARVERGVHPGVDRVASAPPGANTTRSSWRSGSSRLEASSSSGLPVWRSRRNGSSARRALEQVGQARRRLRSRPASARPASTGGRSGWRTSHARDADLAEAAAAAQVARRLVDLGDRHAQRVHVLGVQPDAVDARARARARTPFTSTSRSIPRQSRVGTRST